VKEQPAPWDPLAALASPEKNLVPRLGILCIQIDKNLAHLMPDLRRSYGIIVAGKAPQSQAQFVDLQPGDTIHAVNNTPIAALPHFQEVINGFKPGDAVVLQIERDARFQKIPRVVSFVPCHRDASAAIIHVEADKPPEK
jgi:S1-C subfamily serine protease